MPEMITNGHAEVASYLANALQLRHGANMAADTGCAVDAADSRKRPSDSDQENADPKRSHYSPQAGGEAGTGMYHLKVLIPCVAAGAIIGKGGETIAQLQKDTGARMKMSKSNDFYPGTTERVCLVTGSVDAIMAVMSFIMEKIKEKPDLVPKPIPNSDAEAKTIADRSKQVKILIPNSTAGMIIGKGGNYIKQIKEESGSYIQLSQKAKEQTLQERCVTIIGEIEGNKKACRMLLQKVVEDPQSGNCPNISYADVTGPVANFNPTGSPYALGQPSFGSTTNLSSSVSPLLLNGLSLNLSPSTPTPSTPTTTTLTAQLLENIKMVLRSSGFSEQATAEVAAAMATLARYGILGMGLGLAPYHPLAAAAAIDSPAAAAAAAAVAAANGFSAAAPPQAASPVGFHATGALSPGGGGEGERMVEVNEAIVGAILGPGGRALVEIQHFSGANIQISKKGIFAPGTRNRIVTITGSPSAIATAQVLIEQKIAEEEAKRARQSAAALTLAL